MWPKKSKRKIEKLLAQYHKNLPDSNNSLQYPFSRDHFVEAAWKLGPELQDKHSTQISPTTGSIASFGIQHYLPSLDPWHRYN